MTLEQINKKLRLIVGEWPMGARVWHRANGKRGVIFGYLIVADGAVRLHVDYGDKTEFEPTCLLSGTKVSDGSDGDEWKDGKEGSEV